MIVLWNISTVALISPSNFATLALIDIRVRDKIGMIFAAKATCALQGGFE